MARKINQLVPADNGRETRVLSNGSIADVATGQIIKGPAMSPDTARDMVRAREAKRIRLYAEGAQLSVADAALIAQYGPDAHIVERGMTLQTIASTPDAGKAAVMAAAHLDKAQGLYTDPSDSTSTAPQSATEAALVGLLHVITQGIQQAQALDTTVDVIPMSMENEAEDE